MIRPNSAPSPRLELSFLLAVGGMFFCMTVLAFLVSAGRDLIPEWLFLLLSTVPIQLSNIFACVVPALKYCPGQPLAPLLDLTPPPRREWRLILFGTVAVYILLAIVSALTVSVLKKLGIPPVPQPIIQLIRQGSYLSAGLLAPVIILLAPLGEELCFRHVIFKKLECHAGPLNALLLTSLLFAGVHLNLQVFPSLFLLGLWLGTLYRRTGSLLSAVAAHSLFNTISFLLICCLPPRT